MKKIIILLLVSLLAKTSYSQPLISKKIPLIRENSQVDSLIQYIAIRDNSNPVCFSIDIKKKGEKYYFEIKTIDKVNSIIKPDYLDNIFNTANLNYFKYKEFLIFVTGDIEAYNLFAKTVYFKTFKFSAIRLRGDNKPPRIKDLVSQRYSYTHGKFTQYSNLQAVY